MAVELIKKRTREKILEIVKDCADRLLYGLQLLISDGFRVYMSVARALKVNLTHVRHIHKPPYGRIIIEIYSYTEFEVSKTIFKTTNEITAKYGWFIGQIKTTKESIGKKKRGRKRGGKNRPKHIIEAEKKEKAKNSKHRGRPPGKSTNKDWDVHVFNHDKKRGRIIALGGSVSVASAAMNIILK